MSVATTQAPAVARQRRLVWGMKWSSLYVVWAMATKIARGLVIPKMIAPMEYGLFSSLAVLIDYSQYSDLGVKYQLSKRLPYELHKNGDEGFQQLVGKGATWTLVTSVLFAAGVVRWAMFVRGEHAWFYRPALLLCALVVTANRLRGLLLTYLMSREEFRSAYTGSMIADGASFAFTLAFLYFLGVIGAVWALLLSEAAGALYLLRHCNFQLGRFRAGEVWPMARESTLLLAVALMDTALMTVDQLFLLRFYSKAQYGVYCLGTALFVIALATANVFLQTVQPRVMGLAGQGKRDEAHRLVDSTNTLFLLLVLAGLALMVPAMAVFVQFYLPKYASGIPTYALMSGFALVRGPALLLRPFYLAHNMEKRLLVFQAAALALITVLDCIVILRGGGINGIAAASFVGYTLVSVSMLAHFDQTSSVKTSATKYLVLGFGVGTTIATWLFFRGRLFPQQFLPYLMQMTLLGLVYLGFVVIIAGTIRRQVRAALQPFVSK